MVRKAIVILACFKKHRFSTASCDFPAAMLSLLWASEDLGCFSIVSSSLTDLELPGHFTKITRTNECDDFSIGGNLESFLSEILSFSKQPSTVRPKFDSYQQHVFFSGESQPIAYSASNSLMVQRICQ
jgi:hypothetical protein